MRRFLLTLVLTAGISPAGGPVREIHYHGAVRHQGQTVPRYDKGYLLYRKLPNTLEVYRPDGQLHFSKEVPCPGAGSCSISDAAVSPRGEIAVTIAYLGGAGYGAGVRFLGSQGEPVRLIETGGYVPGLLTFDVEGGLWTLGWQRSAHNPVIEDRESGYSLVRKYSPDGRWTVSALPRSLWPGPKSQPGRVGGGYWRMVSAGERVGALIHESHSDNDAEWVEWDLNGKLVSRTQLPHHLHSGRAVTAAGDFYAVFPSSPGRRELRRLDKATGQWIPAGTNLPPGFEYERAFLLGAEGEQLVYSAATPQVRLIFAQPGR